MEAIGEISDIEKTETIEVSELNESELKTELKNLLIRLSKIPERHDEIIERLEHLSSRYDKVIMATAQKGGAPTKSLRGITEEKTALNAEIEDLNYERGALGSRVELIELRQAALQRERVAKVRIKIQPELEKVFKDMQCDIALSLAKAAAYIDVLQTIPIHSISLERVARQLDKDLFINSKQSFLDELLTEHGLK